MKGFKRIAAQVFIALVCIIAILVFSNLIEHKVAVSWATLALNLSLALLASIITGVYYEVAIRDEFKREIFQLLNLSQEISKSGISNYYSNFSDIQLAPFVENAKEIDIYVTYGQTVLNGISSSLESFLTKRGNKLSVFMTHEDNLFVEALGAHWGNNQLTYNSQGIKSKIIETKDLLDDLIKRLQKKGKLKAVVQIYQLKRHPVFYSFYRFDNTIIFSPSKISESKTIKPLALIVHKSSNGSGIYERCVAELNSIREDDTSYTLFTSKK